MLYKYLFYSVSYWVKKYDKIWNTGDIYYAWGGMTVGIIIALTITNVMDIIGLFFYQPLIWSNYTLLAYLPIAFGIISIIFFSYKKRHKSIYEEVKSMETKKKKKYKILNIIHIFLVLTSYFILGDIVRHKWRRCAIVRFFFNNKITSEINVM